MRTSDGFQDIHLRGFGQPDRPAAQRPSWRPGESAGVVATTDTLAKVSFGLPVILLCVWFALQPISSDLTNYLTFRVVVNLRPDRLVFLLMVVLFVFHRKARVGMSGVEVALGVTFIVALWSYATVGAPDPYQRYISTIFSFFGMPLATYYIARRIRWTETYVFWVMATFLVTGAYLGFTGIFEHYRIDALVFPRYILDPWQGIGFGRARGPFVQPAVFGAALTLILFTCLPLLFSVKRGPVFTAFVAVSMVAMLASVYFSYTRANWVMLGVGAVVLGLLPGVTRRYVYVLALLVLLVSLSGVSEKLSFYSPTLFSRRSSTIDDRLNIMLASWNMFLDKPGWGHGYGNFERENDDYFEFIEGVPMRGNGEGNHNAVLGVLAELGLAGGVPYLMTFALLFFSTLRTIRAERHRRGLKFELSCLFLASLCGYFVAVQTYDPRFFTMLNSHLFLLAGLSHAIHVADANQEEIADGGRPERSPRPSQSPLARPGWQTA